MYCKDNVKTAHWVVHQQFRSLDTYNFFKRTPVVDDIQDSVTGNTIKHSDEEKKNPYLLQEEEEQEYEEANDDADVNSKANKVNEHNNGIFSYNKRREEDFRISRNNKSIQ